MPNDTTPRPNYAVFYDIDTGMRFTYDSGIVYYWFGYDTLDGAQSMYQNMIAATNHADRMPRGFSNVRMCKRDGELWRQMLP